MKIGLFTDSYFPSTNGIVYVVEILRKDLESLGHEVWVFAPEPRARMWFKKREHNIVRFAALEGLLFDEQQTSFFFPQKQLKRIADLDLDAVIMFTPGQIGLMGARSALETGKPLIQQYCTDLVAYAVKYPAAMPLAVALLISTPVTLKIPTKKLLKFPKIIYQDRHAKLTRTQDFYRHILNLLHDQCDLLVAVSSKSADQLKSYHGRTPITVIPTGVNPLPINKKQIIQHRRKWRVSNNDIVYIYVGRLGVEKNIELLIDSFAKIAVSEPRNKLVLVGGFSHGEELKKRVVELGIGHQVIFYGRQLREKLGSIYAAADIFCFPSVTDTQALVLNEAAHAGLPIIWCDKNVNDVAIDGKTGILVKPKVTDFSKAMIILSQDKKLRMRLGANAKKQAAKFTEKKQALKLVSAIKKV